jgi:hypothetical protein
MGSFNLKFFDSKIYVHGYDESPYDFLEGIHLENGSTFKD